MAAEFKFEVAFRYRCRHCTAMFDSGTRTGDHVADDAMLDAIDGHGPAMLELVTIHRCSQVQSGLADLIGWSQT